MKKLFAWFTYDNCKRLMFELIYISSVLFMLAISFGVVAVLMPAGVATSSGWFFVGWAIFVASGWAVYFEHKYEKGPKRLAQMLKEAGKNQINFGSDSAVSDFVKRFFK